MDNFLQKVFIEREHKKEVYFNSTKSLRYEVVPKRLYTYEVLLAEKDDNNNITVYNLTAPGGNYYSQTTSQHVGKVVKYLTYAELEFDLV